MQPSQPPLRLEELARVLDSAKVLYETNGIGEKIYMLYSGWYTDTSLAASGDSEPRSMPPYIKLNISSGLLTLEGVPGPASPGRLITLHQGSRTRYGNGGCPLFDYSVILRDNRVSIDETGAETEIAYVHALKLIINRFNCFTTNPIKYSRKTFEDMKNAILNLKQMIDQVYSRPPTNGKIEDPNDSLERRPTKRGKGAADVTDIAQEIVHEKPTQQMPGFIQGTLFG